MGILGRLVDATPCKMIHYPEVGGGGAHKNFEFIYMAQTAISSIHNHNQAHQNL
jgi:hypothetical protein